MKTKRSYLRPTIHVVEMTISKVLLEGSITSAELEGYTYDSNGWED